MEERSRRGEEVEERRRRGEEVEERLVVRQGTVEGEEEVSIEVTMTDNTLLTDTLATPDSEEFRWHKIKPIFSC